MCLSIFLETTPNMKNMQFGLLIKPIGIYSGRINSDSDLGYVWKWSIIEDIRVHSVNIDNYTMH